MRWSLPAGMKSGVAYYAPNSGNENSGHNLFTYMRSFDVLVVDKGAFIVEQ
jgi:hypothetical protein